MKWAPAIVVLCVLSCVAFTSALNGRPIIGILTQPSSSTLSQFGNSYIAASYVKYAESGGARVVPIHYNSTQAELQDVFSKINGVLFPGGGADLDNTTLYQSGQYLYNLAIEANNKGDYFPIFGHCMGFELLNIITSENFNILGNFNAENVTLPLNFTTQAHKSRLFGNAPADIIKIFSSEPVTMNNHQEGVSPSAFNNNKYLPAFYDILSNNDDLDGKVFISTIEGKKYPIYGIQWHAEKPQFEWNSQEGINHDAHAILAMQYMQNFFISEARKSNHKYPTEAEENAALIYNFQPVYTYALDPDFEQCYFWNE